MKLILNKYIKLSLFSLLTCCVSWDSGSLKNYVTLEVDKKIVKAKLPSGFCTDESPRILSDSTKVVVITNCVSLKKKNNIIFGRRPVDAIIHLTATKLEKPTVISENLFLNEVKENIKFQAFSEGSKSINLKVNSKSIRDGMVKVDLQQKTHGSFIRKVRKYIFLIGNETVIMTITSFEENSQPAYSDFELLIKSLKNASS